MPTIIDTLILEIGLDPSKFKKGQRDTTDATRKLKETAQKDLGAVEKSGNDAAASFELLGRRALSLFALFSGSAGLADFARRTIETNASTGKLAKTLDLTVKTLSTWRNVAVLTGGSVMAIQNSIVHLVSDFQTLALTGNSQTIPYFRALNIPVADAAGHMRKMDDILLDLADRFHHMDPARAAAWGRALGFDQDTINALIRGRDAVKALMDQARSLGTISDRDAASAIALQTAWGQVSIATQSAGRNMLTDLATFAKASSWLQDFFNFAISHTTGKGLGSLFDWIGRHDNLLGGTTPKLPTGGQAQRDIAFFESKGWSRAQATGIVANLSAESGGIANKSGDHGAAYGLAQWHKARQEAFAKWAGHSIRSSTRREQLAFVDYELRHGERAAGTALAKTTTPGAAARVVSRLYERPDHAAAEATRRAAMAYALGVGRSAAAAGMTVVNNDNRSEVRIGTLNVQTQAKDAEGIAKDIGPAIRRSGMALQGNYGAN